MNRKDRIGWTGLMWAVRSGCALHLVVFRNNKVLKLLLYVPDIDVNIVNTEGLSGVHWAEFVNNIEALKLLLSHPGLTTQTLNQKDQDYGFTV